MTSPTLQLSPTPIQFFLGNDGRPCAGGTLLTQVGGLNYPTYEDSGGTIPLPNPIPLNSRGEVSNATGLSRQLFLDQSVAYTFTLFDSDGKQISQPATVSTGTGYGTYYPPTAGEVNTGVTIVNPQYPPGWVQRYGAVADSGITDNWSAFQAAIGANAGQYPVVVTPMQDGYFGGFTQPLSVPGDSTIILDASAELRWASTSATGPVYLGALTSPGLILGGDNITIRGGILSGPSGPGVYTSNEVGIIGMGNPNSVLRIEDVEIRWWGSDGIVLEFWNNWVVRDCILHDNGYAGMHALSCVIGLFQGNEVYNIEPGTNGNAYGFSGTFDSNFTQTGTRDDPHHFCIGITVRDNFIHDISPWVGIDFHGAFDCVIESNQVYNCWTGVQIGSAAGAGMTEGQGYGAENCIVAFNQVNTQQYDGTPGTQTAPETYGITVNGGVTSDVVAGATGERATGMRIIGNVINGCGNTASPPTGFSIQASYLENPIIQGNLIRNWMGYGIYSQGCIAGIYSGNVFTFVQASSPSDTCIYLTHINSGPLVTCNQHRLIGDSSSTGAHYGIAAYGGGATIGMMYLNDMAGVTSHVYVDPAAGNAPFSITPPTT